MTLIDRIKYTIFLNPIVMKELLLKFRYKRFFMIASAYILFTFLAILFFLKATGSYAYRSADFISWMSEAARGSFLFLSFWQFAAVALITMSFSSASLTSEKEKNTLTLLFSSQLDAQMIIFGKFITAIMYNLITITILLPIFSIIFILGGISVGDILLSYALIFFGTSLFTALAIFWSTVFKSAIMANIVSYLTGGAFVFGPLLIPYVILEVIKLKKVFTVSYRDAILFLPQHFNPLFPLILMFEKIRAVGGGLLKRFSYKIFILTSCSTIMLLILIFLFLAARILKKKLQES